MKRQPGSVPALPLGLRIGLFMSLAVLGAVLLTALVLEILGRGDTVSDAVERLRRARSIAADRLHRDGEALSRLAVTVSRDPRFYGLLARRPTERGPGIRRSLEEVVREFQRDAASEIFDVTDVLGATLAASPRAAAPEANRGFSALVREALAGRAARGYRVEGGRLYRVAVVPVPRTDGKVVGTLTLGSPVDDDFATAVRHAGGADLLILSDASSDGGPGSASAHRPVVSTLTDAGTRSVLTTVGPATREPDRWTERDVKRVSIAKFPGMAADVPLAGLIEGGSPRILVATALVPVAGLAAAREALLAVGGATAFLAFLFGWIAGARIAARLKRLGAAVREMRGGNHDWPLPPAGRDEAGALVSEFEGMREAQRQEIDRLVAVDRMKSDFLAVTAQEIAIPAQEIAALARALAAGRAGALKPAVVQRLRAIHRHATNLAQLAEDLAGMNVVSRFGAADVPSSAEEKEPEATLEVVAEEEKSFQPVIPRPEPETIGDPADDSPSAGDYETAAEDESARPRPPLDVGAVIEGIATELVLDAAARGIGVDLEVEPDLIYSPPDDATPAGADLEARIRDHVATALRLARPGATLSLAARRLPDGIEVSVGGCAGGPEPLRTTLPPATAAMERS